jgi:hypothetical protein
MSHNERIAIQKLERLEEDIKFDCFQVLDLLLMIPVDLKISLHL